MAANGAAKTKAALKAYTLKIRREAKKAVARVTTQALQAAKAALPPDRTGMLRRSMGKKVAIDRQGNPYGLVGPRRRFRVTIATEGKKTTATFASRPKTVSLRNVRVRKPRDVVPTKYSHLVVKGTKRSRARDFLAPARAVFRQRMKAELAAAIKAVKGA